MLTMCSDARWPWILGATLGPYRSSYMCLSKKSSRPGLAWSSNVYRVVDVDRSTHNSRGRRITIQQPVNRLIYTIMSKGPTTTPLDYRLPSTVESIQQGWLISCQSSAVISGLLAIVSVILFRIPPNNIASSKTSSQIQLTMDLLGYASLIFNASACASCFIILDRLGDVPYRAARQRNVPKGGKISLPSIGILKVYGIGALWRWAVWHWLICFLFGFWTIVAQILVFVWIQATSKKLAVSVTCLGGFCLLPWIAFILAPLVNGLSRVHAKDEEASLGSGDQSSQFRDSGLPHVPLSPVLPRISTNLNFRYSDPATRNTPQSS